MARTPKPIGLSSGPVATTPVATQETFTSPVIQPSPVYSPPAVQSQPTGRAVVLTMEEADKAISAPASVGTATKKINELAKLSDMDELGTLVGNALTAAKGYDPTLPGYKGTGFLGFFKRKFESARQRYESVDAVVNRLVGEMDGKIRLFTSRIHDLEQIAVQNRAYYDSLTPQIAHLQAGIEYMENNPPVVDPNDHFSAKKAQEWHAVIAWARKRASDLERSQVVATQQDAIIDLMQQNSRAMAARFKDLKETVLPLMQQNFALFVINQEQAAGAKLGDAIADAGDDALKQVAAKLGQNTVAIQTSLNRSNFSIEAISAQHDAVVQALDDIERIRAETKTRLAAEAPVLEQKSRELAARLAQTPKA